MLVGWCLLKCIPVDCCPVRGRSTTPTLAGNNGLPLLIKIILEIDVAKTTGELRVHIDHLIRRQSIRYVPKEERTDKYDLYLSFAIKRTRNPQELKNDSETT